MARIEDLSYSTPGMRKWFDELPNPNYWTNCAARGQESLAKDKQIHREQRE